MEARISQAQIARVAGVHQTTISMALRGHPSIPTETRERIVKLAETLGYRPDPVLSALNVYRHAQQRPAFQGVIAWINRFGEAGRPLFQTGTLSTHWAAAKQRCEELGYGLEQFNVGKPGYTGVRLSTILRGRGIQGIIVPPIPGGRGHLRLSWEWFSAVAMSFSLARPALHTFVPDHFNNMRLVLRELRRAGRRLPGLVMRVHDHQRTDNLRAAAFLVLQSAQTKKHVPILWFNEQLERGPFLAWFAEHRPDAVVMLNVEPAQRWLRDAGYRVPQDTVLVDISARADAVWPGLVENNALMARMAVDHLIGMISRGERGIPTHPTRTMVTGTWNPGKGTS